MSGKSKRALSFMFYFQLHFSNSQQQGQERAEEIHNKLEKLVDEDKKLKELAANAFQSFVKSYATYPKSLKAIFHINNLHLGHVAKSFALQVSFCCCCGCCLSCFRETPSYVETLTKVSVFHVRLRSFLINFTPFVSSFA